MLPKVLVISHTCFSLNDPMGSTLASYFSTYDSNSVAQFYIKDMVPNSQVCKNYFRTTDRELLSKTFHPFTDCAGQIIDFQKPAEAAISSASADNLGGKNRWFNMILRNVLWGFKGWKTKR